MLEYGSATQREKIQLAALFYADSSETGEGVEGSPAKFILFRAKHGTVCRNDGSKAGLGWQKRGSGVTYLN